MGERPHAKANTAALAAIDHRLRFPFLAKVRQQQEQPGKTFLTRIEQLIDEVVLRLWLAPMRSPER